MTPADALQRAINSDLFTSQRAFAAALSLATGRRVTSQAISQWKVNGVPEDRCEPIEAVTKGAVRVEELRPDIQWQRDPQGRVTGYLPSPVPIQPTRRRRAAKARA